MGGVEWAHSSIELGDFVNRIGRCLEKASHIIYRRSPTETTEIKEPILASVFQGINMSG